MKVLVADDNLPFRRALEAALADWGFEAVGVADGVAAWEALRQVPAPELAILDWTMPGLDGLEVCRRVRALPGAGLVYLILLTAHGDTADVVAGLGAGADDYLAKPADLEELRARLRVGSRLVALQKSLAGRVRELEQALAQIQQLRGLLRSAVELRAHKEGVSPSDVVEDILRSALASEVEELSGGPPLDVAIQRMFEQAGKLKRARPTLKRQPPPPGR